MLGMLLNIFPKKCHWRLWVFLAILRVGLEIFKMSHKLKQYQISYSNHLQGQSLHHEKYPPCLA